ncbi:hypothetical protein [Streptomyces resistomycificus]|uniref:WXG100 family type VII secretion target n=1 Tax=Streptomyces resistomycificus TaxID=67356 RepID=A0A0L8LIK9_9ACTN|nr:hypothetical protein [Streptomyces resistomycificus]KOG37944.1 hypothetical protein ADK37_10795 [Streptomyces resistomycificus]
MKFDMGAQTLSNLQRDSRGSSDDLGALVRQLVQAAAPLEGKFNGTGRAMFDQFKGRADQIANDLNGSLSAILGGQSGMDAAFSTGDQEQGDNARQQMSAANFDGARFR